TGAQAGIVTVLGIVVPMGLGVLASLVLPPVLNEVTGETDMVRTIFRNCFYGVILTATSVSVTIAALK
ncbi:MAG: hypothetical protein J6R47_04010, partial [Acholeplasmatales bacterium]|nr:hypothetical protein [Acholeplasmatales bacterium]